MMVTIMFSTHLTLILKLKHILALRQTLNRAVANPVNLEPPKPLYEAVELRVQSSPNPDPKPKVVFSSSIQDRGASSWTQSVHVHEPWLAHRRGQSFTPQRDRVLAFGFRRVLDSGFCTRALLSGSYGMHSFVSFWRFRRGHIGHSVGV